MSWAFASCFAGTWCAVFTGRSLMQDGNWKPFVWVSVCNISLVSPNFWLKQGLID